jgi:hypothetical protein
MGKRAPHVRRLDGRRAAGEVGGGDRREFRRDVLSADRPMTATTQRSTDPNH